MDSKDQARLEAGDLKQPLGDGSIHWTDIRELGQIIAGRQKGRERPEDITLFKSVGVALEDVAVGQRVLEKAKQAGVDRTIEW